MILRYLRGDVTPGVLLGNMTASTFLMLILVLSLIAACATIVFPLRVAARTAPRKLLVTGTVYFALIGMGFMFAEISLLQFFGVFLGHPTYAMGICLFSLILSSGLGSLTSGRFPLDTQAAHRRVGPADWWLPAARAGGTAPHLRGDDRAAAGRARVRLPSRP